MTPQEKDLIATPVYLCSEDEKLSRKCALNKIKDIIDIAPHEYDGVVTGYKLGVNAFNLFKNEFK